MRSLILASCLAAAGLCTISIDGDEDENAGAGGGDTAAVVNSDESVEEQLDAGNEGPAGDEAEESDGSEDGEGSDGEDD